MSEVLDIEVVFATPDSQVLVSVSLPREATVADAIEASGLKSRFPAHDLDLCTAGVWGSVVQRDRRLRSGDRVELYRPLEIDPREARRRLASAGRTMRDGRD